MGDSKQKFSHSLHLWRKTPVVQMSPWPEAPTQSPMISPIPQSPDDKDPFAVTYGVAAPGIPQFNQFNQQQPTPVQQQQPYQMVQPYQMQQQLTQQPQQVDPWASMLATPPAAPSFNEAPKQMTPPPLMVVYDASQQNDPPSPMGDVSVLAAAFGNVNGATQPLQQLQPMLPAMMEQMMPSTTPAIAPANPFDFDVVATSIPNCSPPKMMPPPVPPPTPPRDINQQMQHLQQHHHQQQTQLPMAFAPPAEPFGFNQQLASQPLSPVPQAAQFNGGVYEQQQQQYAVNHGAMVPAATRAMSPYGFSHQGMHNDPFGYAFSPMASPVPQSSPGNGGNILAHDPFAASPPLYNPIDSGAMVVSNAANEDPFGVFGGSNVTAMVPSSPTCHDPYNVMGGSMTSSLGGSGTMVTASSGGDSDPFGGMFGAPTTPAEATVTQDAGFGQSHPHRAGSVAGFDPRLEHPPNEKDISLDTNGLPSDGEYYEARINARSLGAMFYTARNLEETLFLKVPNNAIEAFGQRPIVAYVAEESAAYNAGVHLGHIIMEVNGEAVSNPEMCATAIRNAPRPLVLRCFAPPDLELTCSEGHHRVKYDVNNLDAPASSMDWKTKYVLVGGIVTKPWMMSMFYKKSDYDIAVKEAHAGQQISVKVKQFDLRGARVVLKGMDGMPNRIKYSDQGKPWYWISIVPNKGYPIKIASESPEGLEPIYAAVRRFVKKDMEARYTSKMSESFDSMRTRRY